MANKVIILGRLGADPDLRSSPSGVTTCRLSIATNRNWTDKSGEKKEETEWHRVVFFGRAAEVLDQYLKKGQQLYVEGRLKTSKYEKDGVERYSTDIIGETFNYISGSDSSSAGAGSNNFDKDMIQDINNKSQEKSGKDEFARGFKKITERKDIAIYFKVNFIIEYDYYSEAKSGHNASLSLLLLLIKLINFLLSSLSLSVEFVTIDEEFGLFRNLKNSLSGDKTIVVSSSNDFS